MALAGNIDIRLKQYETAVVDFIRKESGYFLLCTHDQTFVRIMRNTISKHLAVEEDCIATVTDENKILKSVQAATQHKKNILLFIERVFNNKETSFLIKQIKEAFNQVKIVILTADAERQRLVLLHEIGANNFISKPISINTLIEKIAFTVKPQGKLGKTIDQGKHFIEIGNYEDALKVARQVLEMKPNSAAGLLILGDAYKGMKKNEKAVEAYEEASRQAKMYLEPLKKLADFYGDIGDTDNQLKYLEKLDRLSPLNVERKVDIGIIHVNRGNEEKADELFEMALGQAKKEAMVYIEELSTRIGDIYTHKNPEKAEAFYRKALATKGDNLDKSDIKTFNLLGIALRKQGKWRDAIIEYQKAVQISPDDENLFYNAAMAYAEGRDYRKALNSLAKCTSLNPNFHKRDAVLSYNMGLIYSKTGDRKRTLHYMNAALEIDPAFEKAKRYLAKLEKKD